MKITLNKFLVIFVLIPFLFIAMIYASFSSELMIDGIGYLRITADIRISNIKVVEQTSGAYETYSSEFNKDSTSIFATLPNIDSTITYEVTIKNSSTISYDLSKLIIDTNSNENIKYEIDIEVGEEIPANSEKTFTIKLFYNKETLPNDITDTLVIRYEFLEHINSYVVATYDYTGSPQTFIAPYNGIYKIELWGAQGGKYHEDYPGGLGAYVSGEINLKENTNLFVYIGAMAVDYNGGYNGGGNGTHDFVNANILRHFAGGGGATDIRLISGSWNEFNSLKSRIMVAGAGSAGYYWYIAPTSSTTDDWSLPGNPGGGLSGYSTEALVTCKSTGGTQTSGGKCDTYAGTYGGFGFGGNGLGGSTEEKKAEAASGGGSGYYGGAGRYDMPSSSSVGGSGSSFISGHDGCDAILESSTENNIIHTGQSIHYSKYQFKNTIMIDGKGYKWTTTKGEYTGIPSHDGTTIIEGNAGNGYAKISFIERVY